MRSAPAKWREKQCRRSESCWKDKKEKRKGKKKKSPASKSVKSSSRIKEGVGGAGNGREEKKLHIKLLMRTAVEIPTTPAGDAKRAAAASRLILAAE